MLMKLCFSFFCKVRVPDITIPIFTIQEGDITVSITMNYHASGFRRHEPDGHVGLGWTLNTGGMITREIRGLPDDLSVMEVPDVSNGIISSDHPNISDYPYLNDLYKPRYSGALNLDHEIDIYNYKFIDYSGRYMSDPYGKTLLDMSDLKLDEIGSFQDPNGITYSFGGFTGVERQWIEIYNVHYETSTTFHMSSILSSKYPGRGINYQYQEGKVFNIYNTTRSQNWQYIWDYGINPVGTLYVPFSENSHQSFSTNAPFSKYTTKFPSQISFSSGTVTFQLSAGKLLDRIDVRNYNGLLINRISFEYGTFQISNTTRSKLQASVFREASNQWMERYTFNYYNEKVHVRNVGTDHWGFYNCSANDDMVPFTEDVVRTYWQDSADGLTRWVAATMHYNLPVGGQARKLPNYDAARTYTLSKITYPTGGFTEFEYEPYQNDIGQVVGGLRIKRIKSYEASGVLSAQKEYLYQGAFQEVIPSYDLYRKDEEVYGLQTYKRLYLNPNLPINPAPQGASIVYGLVTEIEGDR